MAERICWIRIDCPASNRPSARASDVEDGDTVLDDRFDDRVGEGLPRVTRLLPALPREHRDELALVADEDDDGPVDREVLEEEIDDTPRISWTSRARMSVLATWTRISKILLRATAEVERLPEDVSSSPSSSDDVLLEVEVAVEVGDRPDEGGGRIPDRLHRRLRPRDGRFLPHGERKVPTVRTSPGAIGEEATKRPLTFTPFVEFWSTMTQRSFSRE